MRRLLTLAVCLSLVALAVWAACTWSSPSTASDPGALLRVASAPGPTPGGGHVARLDAVARTEVPVPDATAAFLVLRGRCVDGMGAPIVGVTVDLSSRPTTNARMEAWCAQHPAPAPVTATRMSDVEGVFEFRFFPPPPFQFSLGLSKDRHVSASRHWPELPPGTTKDIGDVVMPSGTILRGRVVDTEGVPVVRSTVMFTRWGGTEGDPARSSGSAVSGLDGSFVARGPLAAGDYGVHSFDRDVVRPAQVAVSGEPIEQFLEVVLAPIGPMVTVSGVVVDEDGAPVVGVQVMTVEAPGASRTLSLSGTDREGRFAVTWRSAAAGKGVALHVNAPVYEVLTTERFAWGRQDVRLVLQRRPEVEVAVLARGATVGDFAVRILPRNGGPGAGDVRVRGRGGEPPVVVRGVRRGEHFVVVDPAGDAFTRTMLGPIVVAAPGRTRVTVTLDRASSRILRLHDAAGEPVVGATVYLVDPLGAVGACEFCPLEQWDQSPGQQALRLDWLATDTRGEVVLRGPAGRPLALSLPGPGHAPTWVSDVHLDVTAPLLVEVAPDGPGAGK